MAERSGRSRWSAAPSGKKNGAKSAKKKAPTPAKARKRSAPHALGAGVGALVEALGLPIGDAPVTPPAPTPPKTPGRGVERVVRGAVNGTSLRIAVICSRMHGQITTRLLAGARSQLALRHVPQSTTTIVWVPGVFEIPLAARALAFSGDVDAVVCLGASVRIDATQADPVVAAVAHGCEQVQLESGIPVAFGVLATADAPQAVELSGGRFGNRGADAVDSAIEMVSLLRALSPGVIVPIRPEVTVEPVDAGPDREDPVGEPERPPAADLEPGPPD
jgi:6,7-dimethyl-8-ribityllumazine synthase